MYAMNRNGARAMTVNVVSAGQHSISLFSVYAPEDASLYEPLKKHLSSLKHQGLISMWSVDNIPAGANRDVEIEAYLNKAQIVLLLISSDFLNSEHCYS